MAKCYRCTLALANLSLWITVIASIVALFAPFWLMPAKDIYNGLFLQCFDPYGSADCKFFGTDDPGPIWFTACQGLWAGGTALIFIIAILSFCLCCDSCQKASCASLITTGTFLAGGALISTVVIYGVKLSEGHDYNRFDRELGGHFDWGFYVAIIAAGFSVITFVLLCLTICCMRK